MLKFLGFLCVFLENEFEIIFLELAIFPLGQGNLMALDFDVIALDDADSRLVDDIAFPRRYELARRNGLQ